MSIENLWLAVFHLRDTKEEAGLNNFLTIKKRPKVCGPYVLTLLNDINHYYHSNACS